MGIITRSTDDIGPVSPSERSDSQKGTQIDRYNVGKSASKPSLATLQGYPEKGEPTATFGRYHTTHHIREHVTEEARDGMKNELTWPLDDEERAEPVPQ